MLFIFPLLEYKEVGFKKNQKKNQPEQLEKFVKPKSLGDEIT